MSAKVDNPTVADDRMLLLETAQYLSAFAGSQ